jgi:hypothetical protein
MISLSSMLARELSPSEIEAIGGGSCRCSCSSGQVSMSCNSSGCSPPYCEDAAAMLQCEGSC